MKRENARLKARNKQLASELAATNTETPMTRHHRWRSLGVIILIIVAGLVLFLGNIFFWAGNTVAKTDRYVKTVTPLVSDPAIQKGLAAYATEQIYSNVDIEPILAQELPPRVAFLAPTLSTQIENQTKNVLNKVVASPKFEEVWVNTQTRTHKNLINLAKSTEGDGNINLAESYSFLSAQLRDTPLSFLADKKLPPKAGSITVVEAQYLPAFHTLVTKIDTWRVLVLLLLVAASSSAVWISKRRRRTTITLGLVFALMMFLTLVAGRVGREIASNAARPEYQEAVRHTYQIVMHQLTVQTFVLMCGGLLVATIAWISGPSRSAQALSGRIQTLLSGKAHGALFRSENGLTLWIGRHKRLLQWLSVGLIGSLMLFTRLTPQAFVLFITLMLVSVLLIELLAAPLYNRNKL